jgi:hypothetical protein
MNSLNNHNLIKSRALTLFAVLFFILILPFAQLHAQNIQVEASQSLRTLFETVEKQSSYRFIVSEDDIELDVNPEIQAGSYALDTLMQLLANKQQFQFKKINNYIVITLKEEVPSEGFSQTIKGVVLDGQTDLPLPTANLVLFGEKTIGSISDNKGYFTIKASIGRQELVVSFIGYETQKIPLLLNTGQEPYLEIKLEPLVSELEEVEIKATHEKAKPLNEAIYVSGRSFSLDEAYRYAGTLGDPARMVRSYAGVVPARDDRNDIIIRGNSPTGLQWRLDDIEIPNPNHYGGIGLTGNTVTLLNINLLDNSDFLTGAFPSEYGNALAGVFDLRLRKPNPDKHQFRIQTGWNGFEGGAEGPISRSNKSTYSATYRYSFLDIMNRLGVDLGVLPQYQDFTAKVDIPVSDKLNISAVGIWGTSFIEIDDHSLEEEERMGLNGQHLKTGSDIAILGLNTKYRLGKSTLLKTGFSFLANKVSTEIDTFNYATDASAATFAESSSETKYSFFSEINHFANKRSRFKAGVRWDTYAINYQQEGVFANGTFQTLISSKDYLNLTRVYAEQEYKFTTRLKGRAGLHAQHLFLNNSFALEPRLGLQYALKENQFLSFSYGNHHQMQPRNVYFVQSITPEGTELTNQNLDFSGAHHFVLGYDYILNQDWRLKTEAYWQSLSSVPVSQDPNATFSMLNVGADFFIPLVDSLVNDGRGRNYGVELTLEKFLSKNYYMMLNTSLFQSEYQPADGLWRSTAFNLNYIVNAMGGYEYWINKKIAVGADFKLTYAGGRPYLPVDEIASVAQGEVVFDNSRAFEERYPAYFRTDLKIYYRLNYRKVYVEFAVDFQNLTNQQNIFSREFIPATGAYRTIYQMGFFPMYTSRILF